MMGIKHKKSKHDKVLTAMKVQYDSWKKVFCPALEADVYFTRLGWDHLCVRKWRTSIEQEERVKILPLAKKLITLSTTYQSVRHQDGFETYEFNAVLGGIRVTAIVSKTKMGFVFFSNFRD